MNTYNKIVILFFLFCVFQFPSEGKFSRIADKPVSEYKSAVHEYASYTIRQKEALTPEPNKNKPRKKGISENAENVIIDILEVVIELFFGRTH